MLSNQQNAAQERYSFNKELVIDKIAILYRESGYAMVGSLIAGLIWSMAVSSGVAAHKIFWWLVLLIIGTALRFVVFALFHKRQPQNEDIFAWYWPYVTTLTVSSLVWGMGIVWAVHDAQLLYQTVSYVFLIGLSGAALVAYGLFVRLALITIAGVLIPMVLMFFWQDGTAQNWLAAAGLWFFITTLRSVTVYNRRVEVSLRQTYLLREANEVAQRHAETDMLTGLKNRRAFNQAAEAVLQVGQREQRHTAMLVIDLDYFKQINDSHGHYAGDTMLKHVADLMQQTLRRSDICGRLGGDEFAVLLPNTSLQAAREVAEKLCSMADQTPLLIKGKRIAVHMSIGVAAGAHQDFASLFIEADQAMYEVKHRGKNQVAVEAKA